MKQLESKYLFLYTIIFSMLYWIAESVIHLFFIDKDGIINAFFILSTNEFIMRVEVILMLNLFAALLNLWIQKSKKAEKQLKDKQKQEFNFLDSLPQTVFEMDKTGRLSYVNKKGFETFQYTDDDFAHGMMALNMLAPEDRKDGLSKIENLKAANNVIQIDSEYTAIKKDGTRFPALIHSTNILNENENTGIRGIVYDLSENHKLQNETKKLIKAVEASPSMIVITDNEIKIEYANEKFLNHTGYSREEIVGKNPRILKSGKTPCSVYENMYNVITQRKEWRGEFINKKKNGELYIEEVKVAPVVNGNENIINYIAIKEDVTEKRKIEHALKESEYRYRTLFETAPIGIGISELGGSVLTANPALLKITGYTLEELKAIPLRDTAVSEKVYAYVGMQLQKHGFLSDFEMQFKKKDGSVYDALLTIKKIEIDQKDFAFTIKRDITAKKEAERNLQKLNKYKELFIDIIKHDLLNVANVIVNGVLLIQDADSKTEINEYIPLVKEASEQLTDLIQNASKFSTLEGASNIDFKQVDINNYLKKAIENAKNFYPETSINISNLTKTEVTASANFLLIDVFTNLITNAVKYAEKGKKIETEVFEIDGQCTILIKDFGDGIEDKHKKTIFYRFERLEREGIQGSGLGLAICKRIVELHNGKIWVEDNPVGGAVFKVSIPLKKNETINSN